MRSPLLVSAALLCIEDAGIVAAPDVVTLPYGTVRGNVLEESVEFLGIPYAAPPKRFAAPTPWTGSYPGGHLEATRYTPKCMQPTANPSAVVSEDCLHLNFYAPRAPASAQLPVMLWLHGGGLYIGSAMNPLYNASRMVAKQQVVVAAANYRLGVFGFGPIREHGAVSANNGLLDQQQAMRWLKAHAASFGGDPSRLTIFGQSGGAKAVGMHMLIPSSAGLFDRAIQESGYVRDFTSLEDGLDQMVALARGLGCEIPTSKIEDAVECLRVADASAMAAQGYTPEFPIVIDGNVVPANADEMLRSGTLNRVPFMLGSNLNEADLFVPILTQLPITDQDMRCVLDKTYNSSTTGFLMHLYGAAGRADTTHELSQLITDILFACEVRTLARGLAAYGSAPWVYSFRRQPACGAMLGKEPGLAGIRGAVHGAEMAYVFQNIEDLVPPNCSLADLKEDLVVSDFVAGLWSYFATTGAVPAGWPTFDQQRDSLAVLDIGSKIQALKVETGFRRGQCADLDAITSAYGVPGAAGQAVYQNVAYGLPECQKRSFAINVFV